MSNSYGGGGYTGWFDGWQNARQRRAIEGLEVEIGALSSSLHRQRREAAQLRSQLSRLQGTLEQRVNRLSRSLAALVELSDVRMLLAMYDPPARVRHWARDAVTAVVDTDKPVEGLPAPPDDVPGYWLGPAVQALVALVRDEDAAPQLATAEQRDRERTALLLTCGLVLGGRAELADRWLAEALGRLSAGTPVTAGQRALWTVMAGGHFGAAGAAVLRQRLAELVDGLTPEQERAEQEAWSARAAQLPAGGARKPNARELLRRDASVLRSLESSARLTALRAMLGPAGDPPPGSAAAGAGAPGEPVAPAAGVAELDQASHELLTEMLHALVDEGTAEEAPLLRRAAELRAAIEDGADPGSLPAGWDADAGDPCGLLRTDAFAADRPELAAVARQAGHRWLVGAATRLAEATTVDRPAQVPVPVPGGEVKVGPTGPDSWELARVRTQIEERPVVDHRADRFNRWLLIAGGVLFLAVIGWPNPLAVLAVLAGAGLLVAGGVLWSRERRNRQQRHERKQADLARAEKVTTETATQLGELHRMLDQAAASATADLAAIRARLTREGAVR